MRRIAITAVVAVLLAAGLAGAAGAGAATRWSLTGAGWGHGIGMSQWGAYGFASHGGTYRQILSHYYEGTDVQTRNTPVVRVLLQANKSVLAFRAASSAGGRNLKPGRTYKATRDGATVLLRSSTGRVLKRVPDLLKVQGRPRVRLIGTGQNGVRDGIYRGGLEIRVARGPGLNAINAVELESYVRGVVPNESPSSWPQAALQAQAVAARTYALATNVGGRGFEQYADTRSQVYRGYLSESPSTGSAIASTRGQVVTYGGAPAVTFFFSTSGGYTEDVENVFTGDTPKPWLRGVKDPYDDASPYHRWGPYSYSTKGFASKLGNWVKGRFQGLDILARGVSPRVVRAAVQGSGGSVKVTGPQLRARLGLRDSWFYLRRVSSTADGGTQARTALGTRPLVAIHGSVSGMRGKFVTLQRRAGPEWVKVADVPVERLGSSSAYEFHVGEAGNYRVLAGWAAGPTLRVVL